MKRVLFRDKKVLSNAARRAAKKQFPKKPQPWHPFSHADYVALKPKE